MVKGQKQFQIYKICMFFTDVQSSFHLFTTTVETHLNEIRKNAELIITQVSYDSQNLEGGWGGC